MKFDRCIIKITELPRKSLSYRVRAVNEQTPKKETYSNHTSSSLRKIRTQLGTLQTGCDFHARNRNIEDLYSLSLYSKIIGKQVLTDDSVTTRFFSNRKITRQLTEKKFTKTKTPEVKHKGELISKLNQLDCIIENAGVNDKKIKSGLKRLEKICSEKRIARNVRPTNK